MRLGECTMCTHHTLTSVVIGHKCSHLPHPQLKRVPSVEIASECVPPAAICSMRIPESSRTT